MRSYEAELKEFCTECGAPPGVWCVYIMTKQAFQNTRVGKPTKRLHNGRFYAAWATERKAKRAKDFAMLREFFARFGELFRVDTD